MMTRRDSDGFAGTGSGSDEPALTRAERKVHLPPLRTSGSLLTSPVEARLVAPDVALMSCTHLSCKRVRRPRLLSHVCAWAHRRGVHAKQGVEAATTSTSSPKCTRRSANGYSHGSPSLIPVYSRQRCPANDAPEGWWSASRPECRPPKTPPLHPTPPAPLCVGGSTSERCLLFLPFAGERNSSPRARRPSPSLRIGCRRC